MFIKKMNKAVILLALLSISAFAQGTFTDSRDGKKYKSVKIGEQTWMAQNLDYKGKDGKLGQCYDNKPANCTKYGRLYKWSTAMDIDEKFNTEKWDSSAVKHQDVCPKGWHLPDSTEWQTLIDFAGGKDVAGKKLKAKSGWNKDNNNKSGNDTDDYGFSALPGGYSDGIFDGAGSIGGWWSASELNSDDAYSRGMHYNYEGVDRGSINKASLFSVRCLQD